MATCNQCGAKTQVLRSSFVGVKDIEIVVEPESNPQGTIVLKPPGGYLRDDKALYGGFRALEHKHE